MIRSISVSARGHRPPPIGSTSADRDEFRGVGEPAVLDRQQPAEVRQPLAAVGHWMPRVVTGRISSRFMRRCSCAPARRSGGSVRGSWPPSSLSKAVIKNHVDRGCEVHAAISRHENAVAASVSCGFT